MPHNFKYIRTYHEMLDVEKKTFGEITLKGPVTSVDWKTDKDLAALVDSTVTYVKKR